MHFMFALRTTRQGDYDGRSITQLTHNYRSHPELLSLPSTLFYDGRLVPCAGAKWRTKGKVLCKSDCLMLVKAKSLFSRTRPPQTPSSRTAWCRATSSCPTRGRLRIRSVVRCTLCTAPDT